MADNTAGADAPVRKTAPLDFFSYNAAGEKLFSIREDIPFEVALEQASCFAATVADLVSQAALDEDTYQLWAASYLAEMSKAILESACKAMYGEKRHE